MFEHARLKLTAWYLIIIMIISLFFSLVIYGRVNEEFERFESMQERVQKDFEEGRLGIRQGNGPRFLLSNPQDREVVKKARERFIFNLGFLNLIIFVGAGTAGYFLAGRTLRPIKEMVDEQNRFITDSSHELRTPLTSLRTEIEVALRNKKPKTENLKKILRSNLEEVIGLQALSDGLLELAQNGSSLKKFPNEKVSVREVVNDAVSKVNKLAKTKQIKIENKVNDIEVLGIKDRLTEVFVILLDNAIKYSKKKEKVEIVSKQTGGKVEISVTDHGMGISEIDLPHIFDRFYRGNKSRTENGYGLGLSIAKIIIQSHKGSISVSSKPGKQTTFIIFLPIS